MLAGDVLAGILTIVGLCQCLYWCLRRTRRRRYPLYRGPNTWGVSPHDFGASLAAVGEMLMGPAVRDGEISRHSQQSAGMASYMPMGTRSLAGTMANRPLPPLPGYDTFGTIEQAALPTQGRETSHRRRPLLLGGEPSSVPPAMFSLDLNGEKDGEPSEENRDRDNGGDECYTTPVRVERVDQSAQTGPRAVTPVLTMEETINAPPPVPRRPLSDDRSLGAKPKIWKASPTGYANVPVPTARRHLGSGAVSAASFPATPRTPDLHEAVL